MIVIVVWFAHSIGRMNLYKLKYWILFFLNKFQYLGIYMY